MAAQKGKDLLLKIEGAVTGTFTTIAGLRSRTLAFNAARGEITHQESVGEWRDLLEGAGMRSARVTGSGIFKDQASDEMVRAAFFAGTIKTFQVVIPDFGTVQGPFHINALELTGRHDNEVAFEIALESAGQLIFTAA